MQFAPKFRLNVLVVYNLQFGQGQKSSAPAAHLPL